MAPNMVEVEVGPTRVAEILSVVQTESSDGVDLPACLARLCARTVPVSGVGLALMTDVGPAGTVAATDSTALQLEELQFSLGEGPCVDASRFGRPVLQPDLARTAPARWPAFAAGAEAAGLVAVFAFPLRVGAIKVGALDLYRTTTGVLSAEELADALSFADAATALLLHLQAQAAGRDLPAAPVMLFDDRAEVHQATGVVSVQAAVGLHEAMLLLRARAYAEQRPIGELALDVLSGVVDFSDDPDRQ
jgi:hypothetical protein